MLSLRLENESELLEFKQPYNYPIGKAGKRLYRNMQKYEYYWKKAVKLGGDVEEELLNRIIVPEGFTYDGASVPRFLWSIANLTPDGKLRAAALVHDWIYDNKGVMPAGSYQFYNGSWINVVGRWTRKDADKMFLKIMELGGVGKTDRTRAYWAVRLFGWIAWKK